MFIIKIKKQRINITTYLNISILLLTLTGYGCGLLTSSGCTDSNACNYDENANSSKNSSCIYTTETCHTCSGETDGTGYLINQDTDNDGVCTNEDCNDNDASILQSDPSDLNCNSIDDVNETFCTDSSACNYYENASNTNPDLCIYAINTCDSCSGQSNGTGTIVNGDINNDNICDAINRSNITDITIDEFEGSALIAINTNTSHTSGNASPGVTPLIHHAPEFKKKATKKHFNDAPLLKTSNHAVTNYAYKSKLSKSIQNNTINIVKNGNLSSQEIQQIEKVFTGTYCDIYIQASYSSQTLTTHITEIGNFYEQTIYPMLTQSNINIYDVNNDQKITIYIGNIGSTLSGYFYSADFFESTNTYTSNQSDIIYINIEDFQTLSNTNPNYESIYHTLAHELQHLINFSIRFQNYEETNNITAINQYYETWIEEGIAEGSTPFLTENQTNLDYYFNTSLNNSEINNGLGLIKWNNKYQDYILAFTFFEYCRIQLNLNYNFYQLLAKNYSIGTNYQVLYDIIEKNQQGVFENFNDVLISYHIANITNSSEGKYGYKNIYSPKKIAPPSTSNPEIGAGGSIQFLSSEYNDFNDFLPTNYDNHIHFIRINNSAN